MSGEQDEPTFAAWCQDIRDTQGTPIFRQLVADLAAEINEGKFDGEGEGRRGEGSEPAGFEARRERDQDQQQQGR